MNDATEELDGPGFDALYAGEIEPELRRLEGRRQQTLQAFFLFLLAGALLVMIEALITHALTGGASAFPPPGIAMLTIFAVVYLGYRPLEALGKRAKADILTALCRPLGVSYRASKVAPPALEPFVDLKLLPVHDTGRFEDGFSGERGGAAFQFCAADLVRGRGGRRRTIFKGLLFLIRPARAFAGVTLALRDAGALERFDLPPSLSKVVLEDPRFEEIFEVYGSDPAEARALLTPAVMEQLLALERRFDGHRLRCAFAEGQALLVLEGDFPFESTGEFSRFVNRRRVERAARSLASLFSLIDRLAA